MKKLGNIGGMISGFISIIFSFVVKGMSIVSYEFDKSYGGDAYTGIQNAAAQTANNVTDLANIICTAMFAFLLVFGIALICFFLSRMAKTASAENTAKDIPAITPAVETKATETIEPTTM